MRKLTLILAICYVTISVLIADHWNPNPSTNYQPMNLFVYGAEVNGTPLTVGDEIDVFDGTILVGAALLNGPIISPNSVQIIVFMKDEPSATGCATTGNFITLKIWKSSTNTEYSYPQMAVQFFNSPWDGGYRTTFQGNESSHIVMLSYTTPAASDIVQVSQLGFINMDFPNTCISINHILNGSPSGNIIAYKFDTPSLDLTFNGIAPAFTGNFSWFIDACNINFFISDTSITLIPPSGVLITDPNSITIYFRTIHGTGPFTALQTSYNSTIGSFTATITGFGEFIIGSSYPFITPPVENLTIVKDEMTTRVLLSWTYDTTNVQFHIYASGNPEGPFQLLRTVTETHAYIYAPTELECRFFYVTAELTP